MTKKNNRRFNISDIRTKNLFKTFIVAEIGINHDGKVSKYKRLINEAYKAGADAVKLQTINPDESYFRNTSSYRAFKNKDFSIEELIKIKKYAGKKKK